MRSLEQHFQVAYRYRVNFVSDLFAPSNKVLANFLSEWAGEDHASRILFVLDESMQRHHPNLSGKIHAYFQIHKQVTLVEPFLSLPGGEQAKNSPAAVEQILRAVEEARIDRHSFIAGLGGGALLDVVGYAAAIAHRGVRHIRIPTTVLSQNDSGVGVKNGINYFGKKNFIGSFQPPLAVFNDDQFLPTLSDRNWRSGIAEAIKVALVRDAAFFDWIEARADALVTRDLGVMNELIYRCAELHLQHISGGDPFEQGSSRPLDFGHWSAHKLEQLAGFDLLHGEAVAIGIALDSRYSALCGFLESGKADRILRLLLRLGFDITHPLLFSDKEKNPLLQGLQEFREHLGGRLTIMLLRDIGRGEEVNHMDPKMIMEATLSLQDLAAELNTNSDA